MAQSQSARAELMEQLRNAEFVDLVRGSVRLHCQEPIGAQATAEIGAGLYERTEPRTTKRNGYRPKVVSTKAGDVELGCVIRRRTDAGSGAKRTTFRSYPDKVPAESGQLS